MENSERNAKQESTGCLGWVLLIFAQIILIFFILVVVGFISDSPNMDNTTLGRIIIAMFVIPNVIGCIIYKNLGKKS